MWTKLRYPPCGIVEKWNNMRNIWVFFLLLVMLKREPYSRLKLDYDNVSKLGKASFCLRVGKRFYWKLLPLLSPCLLWAILKFLRLCVWNLRDLWKTSSGVKRTQKRRFIKLSEIICAYQSIREVWILRIWVLLTSPYQSIRLETPPKRQLSHPLDLQSSLLPNSSFFESTLGSNTSYAWRGIYEAKHWVEK